LPEHTVYSREQAPSEPPTSTAQPYSFIPDSSANGKDALDRSPCWYRAHELILLAKTRKRYLTVQARKTLVSPFRLVIPRRSAHFQQQVSSTCGSAQPVPKLRGRRSAELM